MALLMFDGFEAYAVSVSPQITGSPWAKIPSITSSGRTGNRRATTRFSADGPLRTNDFSDVPTCVVGFGLLLHDVSTELMMLRFVGDHGGVVASMTTQNATMRIKDGAGTTLVTLTDALLFDWQYVEMKVVYNGAQSNVEVRINGATVYSSGDINLNSGASVGVRRIEFCDFAYTGSGFGIDDVYACDGSGATQNDFLGPVKIFNLNPNSDDAVSWTPNSGSTNYTQVDEGVGSSDSDTTYVASNTVGAKDIYGLADLSETYQNPVAVQQYWVARHDDSSGGASMAALLKSGVTEIEGSEVVLSSAYTRHAEPMYVTNPDTSAPWTPAEINALQVGAIVKSNL